MSRLSFKFMVLPVAVLVTTSCCGCSSETDRPETTSYSDNSSRQSSIIINEVSPSSSADQKTVSSVQVKLSSPEKEILNKAHEQVKTVITIIEKIVDADTASLSLQKLWEARRSLQKTRADLRKTVSNRRKYFLLFTSKEGKLLQQAMWSMKNELLRLESDEEIQTILTDGIANYNKNIADTELARKERKQFTVTASNIPTDEESTQKSGTLIVSEEPAP